MAKQNVLQFAALIRVSTDAQEKQGESLLTQRTSLTSDIAYNGGNVDQIQRYGGQEHATAGHERKEIDRLIADARLGKFDAVIVAHADRWSRDNEKSREGLAVFKAHGIRFFIGRTEYDLHNPEHILFLGMSAVIGSFQAAQQNKKSLENRIHRARRGYPTCGKLPFGRTFDKATGRWIVDDKKRQMINTIAARYLAGEQLPKLAEEYRVNHSGLHRTLLHRCGPTWDNHFDSDEFNIHETVTHDIPPLLTPAVIKAVQEKAKANRGSLHGTPKHKYLLAGHVFCGCCGYVLIGQSDTAGQLFYRHPHRLADRPCGIRPRPWLRADQLEREVIQQLFECFGNPAAVARAINEATPNREKVEADRKRQQAIDIERKKISAARQKILRHISDDLIDDADAAQAFARLKHRHDELQVESETLANSLGNIPSAEKIKSAAKSFSGKFRIYADALLAAKIRTANTCDNNGNFPESMKWEDRRELVKKVFNGKAPNGKPAGIHVFEIPGQVAHRPKAWKITLFGTAPADGIKSVVQSVCRSPDTLSNALRFTLSGIIPPRPHGHPTIKRPKAAHNGSKPGNGLIPAPAPHDAPESPHGAHNGEGGRP